MWNFLKTLVRKLKNTDCPDCGWLVACDECSKRFDVIDEELKISLKERR